MELLNVRVIPNAKKNGVSEERGRLRVHVVRIIRGEKSREKVVEIRGR